MGLVYYFINHNITDPRALFVCLKVSDFFASNIDVLSPENFPLSPLKRRDFIETGCPDLSIKGLISNESKATIQNVSNRGDMNGLDLRRFLRWIQMMI